MTKPFCLSQTMTVSIKPWSSQVMTITGCSVVKYTLKPLLCFDTLWDMIFSAAIRYCKRLVKWELSGSVDLQVSVAHYIQIEQREHACSSYIHTYTHRVWALIKVSASKNLKACGLRFWGWLHDIYTFQHHVASHNMITLSCVYRHALMTFWSRFKYFLH